MRQRLAATALVGVVSPLVAGLLTPAFGAGETNIDYVEVADDGNVSVLLAVDGIPAGEAVALGSVKVTVGDRTVDAEAKTVEGGEVRRTTVLALDTSLSMEGSNFEAAKSAAASYANAAPDDVEVGLLTFSADVEPVIEPTGSRGQVVDALDDLTLTWGTSLYDAVMEAVTLSGDDGARSVLLLSDGRDQGSDARLSDAVATAKDSGVVVDVVALDQDEQNRQILSEIAGASGGKVIPADASALSALFAAQADALSDQLLVTFQMPEGVADEADISVSIAAGQQEYADSAFVTFDGIATDGPKPVDVREPLLGQTALWAGGAALAVGLAGLLSIVLVGSSRHAEGVQQQMAFYTGAERASATPAPPTATTSLRQTAVAATERLVKGDFESRISARLNGAGVNLTAAEWLLLHAAIATGSAFAGLTFGGGPMIVVLGLAGVVVPWFFLKIKHSRRLAAFNSQLAETLQLISGGLSAGLSLPQAIDTVVREGQEPVAGEMRRALVEQRLGVDIEDALDGVAERMESKDFSWVVMAIRIQREVGGNLAELLITVADTLRERDYLRGQVKVLSAEGRISAWVLGGLPILMFLYMLMVRRDFVRPLYSEPLGLVLSGIAVTLIALGFWTMSRLVKIEV